MTTAEQWEQVHAVRNRMKQAKLDYEQAVKDRNDLVKQLSKTYKVTTLARMFDMKHQNVSKLMGAPNVIEPTREDIKEIVATMRLTY